MRVHVCVCVSVLTVEMIFVQTACVQCVTEIIDGAAQQLLRSVAQKRSHSAHTETHTRQNDFILQVSNTED